MGNRCCSKRRKLKKNIVLLLLGLDNAGKTVAAKGLAGEPIDSVMPTVGFSVVNLNYFGHKVRIFDLGGSADIRGIWEKYFTDAHGIIFVVDSSDLMRIIEVKQVLQEILSNNKISGKPVLLLANKQDNEGALDEIDVVQKLSLEALVNEKQCPTLVKCCAAVEASDKSKIDPGIKDGYEWLVNYIIREYETLNKRVEVDVHYQEIIERQARLEKIERLRCENDLKNKINDEDAIESFSEYNRKINGNVKSIEEQQSDGEIIVLHATSLCNSDSDVSKKSCDSFPTVYNVDDKPVITERPKSAVQIVKEQLKLGQTRSKTPLISLKCNKTVPVSLYGVKLPHSAEERRKEFAQSKRSLRSAGDSAFVVTDIPTTDVHGPYGDELHKQLFELGKKKSPLI